MKLQINESNFQAYTCHSHKVSFLPFITNEKRKCFALIACHFLCIYSKTKAYNIERMGGTINGRQGTRLDCDIPPPLKKEQVNSQSNLQLEQLKINETRKTTYGASHTTGQSPINSPTQTCEIN